MLSTQKNWWLVTDTKGTDCSRPESADVICGATRPNPTRYSGVTIRFKAKTLE